jgi:hypothetical protein
MIIRPSPFCAPARPRAIGKAAPRLAPIWANLAAGWGMRAKAGRLT